MLNIRTFLTGLRLLPKTPLASDTMGELEVDSVSGKLNYYNGVSRSPAVTESHSATLTNKTMDGMSNTFTNIDISSIKPDVGSPNTVLQRDGSGVIISSATLPSGTQAIDTGFTIVNVSDNTKQIQFDLNSLNSASLSILTVPGPIANETFVLKDFAQTLTNKTLNVSFNSITSVANRVAQFDSGQLLSASSVTTTELGYLSGVTSAIQTQLNNKQPLDSTLTALAAYNTNGILTQTAADTFTGRTITAGSSKISISNGDGVAGNPSVDVTEANLTISNMGGTLAIAHGGTGQTTANAGFNALSPMTTGGDLIYGGASGIGTRLANGSSGQVLTSNGGTTAPSWTTPSSGTGNSPYLIDNAGFAFSVGASALTIALKQSDGSSDPTGGSPAKIAFRNTTANDGSFSLVSATAATSLVIPSGATMGGSSGSDFYIYIYAINNAGTIELAASSVWQNEKLVATSTAISAASDDNGFYSTTARSSKAIRLLGRIKYNTAPNGTYSATPDSFEMVTSSEPQALLPYFSSVTTATSNDTTSPTVNTWYQPSAVTKTLQPGTYRLKLTGVFELNETTNGSSAGGYFQFGTSSTPGSGLVDRKIMGGSSYADAGSTSKGAQRWHQLYYLSEPITVTTTTTYYINFRFESFSGSVTSDSLGIRGDLATTVLEAIQIQ